MKSQRNRIVLKTRGGVVCALVSFFFAFADKGTAVLPEILSESETEGFVDMVFAVTAWQALASGDFMINMEANANGDKVALRTVLGRDWKKGTLGGQITTFQGSVTLARIDERSDRLLRFMDQAYGTHLQPAAMKEAVRFIAISLEGDPAAPLSGPVKIKLFFDSENENEYAEAYLNLDLARGRAWLNEKDPGYRQPLLNDLKKK